MEAGSGSRAEGLYGGSGARRKLGGKEKRRTLA